MTPDEYPDDYTAWHQTMRPWLIAEEVIIASPFFNGRCVVEDVEESYGSTTYTLRSLDVPPVDYTWYPE